MNVKATLLAIEGSRYGRQSSITLVTVLISSSMGAIVSFPSNAADRNHT
jgi:hypothetical protein